MLLPLRLHNIMPRKVKFNSARQASARKETAKNKDCGGGGKFTKVCVHATACDEDVTNHNIITQWILNKTIGMSEVGGSLLRYRW